MCCLTENVRTRQNCDGRTRTILWIDEQCHSYVPAPNSVDRRPIPMPELTSSRPGSNTKSYRLAITINVIANGSLSASRKYESVARSFVAYRMSTSLNVICGDAYSHTTTPNAKFHTFTTYDEFTTHKKQPYTMNLSAPIVMHFIHICLLWYYW